MSKNVSTELRKLDCQLDNADKKSQAGSYLTSWEQIVVEISKDFREAMFERVKIAQKHWDELMAAEISKIKRKRGLQKSSLEKLSGQTLSEVYPKGQGGKSERLTNNNEDIIQYEGGYQTVYSVAVELISDLIECGQSEKALKQIDRLEESEEYSGSENNMSRFELSMLKFRAFISLSKLGDDDYFDELNAFNNKVEKWRDSMKISYDYYHYFADKFPRIPYRRSALWYVVDRAGEYIKHPLSEDDFKALVVHSAETDSLVTRFSVDGTGIRSCPEKEKLDLLKKQVGARLKQLNMFLVQIQQRVDKIVHYRRELLRMERERSECQMISYKVKTIYSHNKVVKSEAKNTGQFRSTCGNYVCNFGQVVEDIRNGIFRFQKLKQMLDS